MQDPQVLRDRLPRDVEVRRDPPRGHFPVADETQDLTSSGLSDGIDGCLHICQYILSQLDTCARLCLHMLYTRHLTARTKETHETSSELAEPAARAGIGRTRSSPMRARTSIAIVALAASCLLTSGVDTAAAQS